MSRKLLCVFCLLSNAFTGNTARQTFFLPREEEKHRNPESKKKRQKEWRLVRHNVLGVEEKKKKDALENFKKKIEERHEQFRIYQEEKKNRCHLKKQKKNKEKKSIIEKAEQLL